VAETEPALPSQFTCRLTAFSRHSYHWHGFGLHDPPGRGQYPPEGAGKRFGPEGPPAGLTCGRILSNPTRDSRYPNILAKTVRVNALALRLGAGQFRARGKAAMMTAGP